MGTVSERLGSGQQPAIATYIVSVEERITLASKSKTSCYSTGNSLVNGDLGEDECCHTGLRARSEGSSLATWLSWLKVRHWWAASGPISFRVSQDVVGRVVTGLFGPWPTLRT